MHVKTTSCYTLDCRVLLELSEEEVDVVDGVELCDEGLYVLQENLQEEMDRQKHTWSQCLVSC